MSLSTYDPNSPAEQAVTLPSAPQITLSNNAVLQRPLTRRGSGPGIIMFLPAYTDLSPRIRRDISLDPEPVHKWAEEGFTVVGVTLSSSGWSPGDALGKAIDVLLTTQEVNVKNKFAVIGVILHRSSITEK
jgi:carboxymethylenebutenolidase